MYNTKGKEMQGNTTFYPFEPGTVAKLLPYFHRLILSYLIKSYFECADEVCLDLCCFAQMEFVVGWEVMSPDQQFNM